MTILAAITPNHIATYWFAIPLAIAMSCVYSASRYESWRKITTQSLRLTGMILGILVFTTIVLLVINTQV